MFLVNSVKINPFTVMWMKSINAEHTISTGVSHAMNQVRGLHWR